MPIVTVVGIFSATVISLMNQKQKDQFVYWLKDLVKRRLKRFVTYPIYWLNSRKCLYCTKVYWGESKQANEKGYVYVIRKRDFLRDIHLKFAKPSRTVNPEKLGVVQILAVYRVDRGDKPDYVDDRFLVLDELLPDSIPMFKWIGYHKWYSGGISYNNKFTCYQNFDKPWKSVVEWKIEEKTENQNTE